MPTCDTLSDWQMWAPTAASDCSTWSNALYYDTASAATAATTTISYDWQWPDSTGGQASVVRAIRQAEQQWRERAPVRQATDDQVAAALRAEKRRATARVAVQRAEDLLLSQLSPEQRVRYGRDKQIVVHVRGKRFEIDAGRQHSNIREIGPDGRAVREFCCYQTGRCPLPDNALAQMLALQYDHDEFLKRANVVRLG